jgi:hypothetical protein
LAEARRSGQWDPALVLRLWSTVQRAEQEILYAYPFGAVRLEKLRALLPNVDPALTDMTPEKRNLRLRELIAPHLRRSADAPSFARFVVSVWGGIYRLNDGKIREWLDEWNQFDDVCVERFVSNAGEAPFIETSRISSWSKLLAFADHERHAIYDSRTATALNCALAVAGDERRFYIPVGRNGQESFKSAVAHFRSTAERSALLGYNDYRGVLHAFVRARLAPTILAAEMTLFANAIAIAGHWQAWTLQSRR